ncbi:hypothetical protein BJ138DRAFT_458623 [Hygrophoropsis aurantiaca]|uniref:Uncharacterized protein n=1 Tax=Hygrophoropsis aurantiaca TaxID=72124 RepID=A0ACB8A3R1_9AGAM|nr:hypothetical protein BJ138DRAFT_458623 [Hygrophoropsis aurantiaca]
MLDAFKIKEFDLQPVYDAWSNPPKFLGDPKKDMPVDEWLGKIKAGCVEHKVPEEYWHKVAQHYMGDKAKNRLEELKKVMAKVNGGKYRWSWKKFKIAMDNMGWEVDASATEPVQIHSKGSGFWLTRRRNSKEEVVLKEELPSKESKELVLKEETPKKPRPNPVKMLSDTAIAAAVAATKHRSPSRSNSTSSVLSNVPAPTPTTTVVEPAVTGANVPVWLLNACHALDFLTSEHPRAMTTLSAVLITAGTLPAIPAISGGTVLATGVAQAVGAIAVGVGNMLKAQQEGQISTQNAVTQTSSR